MTKQYIGRAVRNRVREAANFQCGYCHTRELNSGMPLEIEHIIPEGSGGTSEESNLWCACSLCNRYKGMRSETPDPESGRTTLFFNPRTQVWNDHFMWSNDSLFIMGISATGRATVAGLKLNNAYIVPARQQWAQAGWHPPAGDRKESNSS